MTTSVPHSRTELAVMRRLRTTAASECARSRLQPHRRELLRDALVNEAERLSATTGAATVARVLPLPLQRRRELERASA